MNPSVWSARLLSLMAVLSLAGCGILRGSPAEPAPERTPAEREARAQAEEGPGDYEDAIPDDAVTRTGLFTTHFAPDGTLLFEIPETLLGQEILLVVGTVEQPASAGSAGGGDILEFQRQGERLLVREKNYAQVADSGSAIWRAVSGMRKGLIVASLEIEAESPSRALVVDATSLFTGTNTALGTLASVDDDASWIDHVAAFPTNVEVTATQTGGPNTARTTVQRHWSFVRLPEDPMMPRLHDARVGVNSSGYIDYSSPEHGAVERRIIRRHRLEKRNPNAAISDPVEPIIYWVDPATPDWLKPWVVSGVDMWQSAFEEAGFSNAIIGRVAPTQEEDPDFFMDDARYSVIYWRPSTVANANGGQVVDPRTGEIIRGRVQMFHNVQNLVRNWYFTQVGPLDPRAQALPLPDSLMGKLVEYVVAHEVGHAIGFPHNMKASAMYPADSIRNADFLARMGGHVSTLMDYSRFNYVAQPEDNIPVHLLIPGVGPYDDFAVKWAYSPIPGARTPEEERPTLDRWARMQDTIPWFRFTTSGAPNDPYAQTEAVGDEDAVKSSTLGLRNLERVMDMLLPVAERPGEDYELLDELYGNVISQWGRYNGHVAAVVGGAYTQERYGTGPRFEPVERERQREAVRFLNANVFDPPAWMLDQRVLRRIEAEGAVDRIRGAQVRVLSSLLSDGRMERLVEYEALADDPAKAYTLSDLMQDLRAGVWTELQGSGSVTTDVYRRNLQRAYVDMLTERLDPPDVVVVPESGTPTATRTPILTDVRPVLRGELRWLRTRLNSAIPRASNDMTRLHLEDLRMEVERLLAQD